MLVKVVVCGFANGGVFPHQVARKLREYVAFRVLAAENFPAHRTIRKFRQLHRDALAGLFVQVVEAGARGRFAQAGPGGQRSE